MRINVGSSRMLVLETHSTRTILANGLCVDKRCLSSTIASSQRQSESTLISGRRPILSRYSNEQGTSSYQSKLNGTLLV